MILGIDFDIILFLIISLIGLVLVIDLVTLVRWLRKILRKKTIQTIPEVPPIGEPVPKRNRFQIKVSRKWLRLLKFLGFNLLALSVVTGILYLTISQFPNIQSSTPSQDSYWSNFEQPIEIVFNMPVATAKLEPFMSSEAIAGRWEYEPYLGFIDRLTRVAKFYPTSTILPEQRLVVYMTGVSRYGIEEDHEHALEFMTPKLPEIKAVMPGHKQEEVKTDIEIVLDLTRDKQKHAQFEFDITPEIEYVVVEPDEFTYKIIPTEELEQSQTYKVGVYRTSVAYDTGSGEVLDQENSQKIHELNFSTVRAPLVKQFVPSGTGVLPEASIFMKFDVEMDKDMVTERLQITPQLEVEFIWLSDKTLQLRPNTVMPKETKYTFTLPAGIQSINGGISETAAKHSFTTIGAIRVNDFSPKNKTVKVQRHNQQIKVTFDQEVDHSSAQQKFSISPNLAGKFSWKGNTMTFKPSSSLAFDTTYTIKLAKGIKSIYGLNSSKTFTSKFSTVSQTTLISNLGLIYQTQNFTCNVTSTRMILASRGLYVGDNQVINVMGQENRPYRCDQNGGPCHWGNPYEVYVGAPNGHGAGTNQKGTWNGKGYGVYWGPVQKVLTHYGIQSKLYRNWSLSGLASEIAAGHPVIIWWYNGVSGGNRMDWKDLDTGQNIYAINGMHSIVVVGFNGDVSNPTSFIVRDPWWGNQVYSREKFNWQWPYFQNTGVAIY